MSKFSANSRYAKHSFAYKVENSNGEIKNFVSAPRMPDLLNHGRHLNKRPLRIDVLADFYLGSSTKYWQLLHHNRLLSSDAVMALEEIKIPVKEGG